VQQAWFDAICVTRQCAADIGARVRTTSAASPSACLERDRINRDTEIAAGSCLAIDGTTIQLMTGTGRRRQCGRLLAAEHPARLRLRVAAILRSVNGGPSTDGSAGGGSRHADSPASRRSRPDRPLTERQPALPYTLGLA
jgi:hypothetical protein